MAEFRSRIAMSQALEEDQVDQEVEAEGVF